MLLEKVRIWAVSSELPPAVRRTAWPGPALASLFNIAPRQHVCLEHRFNIFLEEDGCQRRQRRQQTNETAGAGHDATRTEPWLRPPGATRPP